MATFIPTIGGNYVNADHIVHIDVEPDSSLLATLSNGDSYTLAIRKCDLPLLALDYHALPPSSVARPINSKAHDALRERFTALVDADYDGGVALLETFNINSFSALQPDQYEAFGNALKELGY